MSLYKYVPGFGFRKKSNFYIWLENSIPVNVFLKITSKSLFRCEYMCLPHSIYEVPLVDQAGGRESAAALET